MLKVKIKGVKILLDWYKNSKSVNVVSNAAKEYLCTACKGIIYKGSSYLYVDTWARPLLPRFKGKYCHSCFEVVKVTRR